MEFRTMTVGDMIEGFSDNMSEKQIDEELKLFQSIADTLKGPGTNYNHLGVLIDEDHMAEKAIILRLELLIGYEPYCEHNKASGNAFLYFKNIEDANMASAYLEAHFDE